jgi:hypothetical protein
MPFQVGVIAQGMFPEPPLPDASFAFRGAPLTQPLARREGAGEAPLDALPARGEVAVAVGQCPDAMQMIRQHDDGADGEGVLAADLGKGAAEQTDVFRQQSEAALQQGDREEERTAGDEGTHVLWHRQIIPRCTVDAFAIGRAGFAAGGSGNGDRDRRERFPIPPYVAFRSASESGIRPGSP